VNTPFNSSRGLIVIKAQLWGPTSDILLKLALDTGATGTLISQTRLMEVGYDPATNPERFQITTGSGIEFVPRVMLKKVVALGEERASFPVLCHNLPANTRIDGLLGLDFFRGLNLNIDFRNGLITLT